MALFSKPPAKKVHPPKSAATPRSDDPRETAGAGTPASGAGRNRKDGPLTMLKWSPERPPIEVDETTPGLCAVLENAALLYASGQEAPARAMLDQGVRSDPEAKSSPLAWQALFDLLQRADDKPAFDQLALQYLVQFEQLAPTWEARVKPQAAPRQVIGGQFSLAGKITGDSAAQFEGLKRAIAKKVPNSRISFAGVTGIDDAGARLVATSLAAARRAGLPLELQHVDAVMPMLAATFEKGRDGGEGMWTLGLELLQWQMHRDEFEERAIDFAVAFEVSPPSWEPAPAPESPTPGHPATPPAVADSTVGGVDDDVLVWSGVLAGSAQQQLGQLAEFAGQRPVVTIDMHAVDRVDWVCAGALLNAITRLEARQKTVQLARTTPIVRALLLLIGIPYRQFVRKAN